MGDWALAHHIPLPRLEDQGREPASIGVIGAGPAGLSFAYQMARRGYRVTVYEKEEKPGGMLYYGIPQYRLPEDVLASEVNRLLDLGIELKLNSAIGQAISMTDLRERHEILFLGIGAGRGLTLGIPGEDGAGTWTGTEYLSQVNRGRKLELGARVVVIGGGNTAIDAARTARRTGAQVTILYRRTRKEMPAIDAEIDDALTEVPDSGFKIPAESVIAAVSQQPDWNGLGELKPQTAWVETAADGEWQDGLWAGGDTLGIGVAGLAIGQGRRAAEAAHARLRGLESWTDPQRPAVSSATVKADFFPEIERVPSERKPAREWLAFPDEEIQGTISEQQFLQEVSRCFSCGDCFGCEQCFMYCSEHGLVRLEQVVPGSYFALNLDLCQACRKCIELCPCGFLSPSGTAH